MTSFDGPSTVKGLLAFMEGQGGELGPTSPPLLPTPKGAPAKPEGVHYNLPGTKGGADYLGSEMPGTRVDLSYGMGEGGHGGVPSWWMDPLNPKGQYPDASGKMVKRDPSREPHEGVWGGAAGEAGGVIKDGKAIPDYVPGDLRGEPWGGGKGSMGGEIRGGKTYDWQGRPEAYPGAGAQQPIAPWTGGEGSPRGASSGLEAQVVGAGEGTAGFKKADAAAAGAGAGDKFLAAIEGHLKELNSLMHSAFS
jgi:hypothetical protein